MSEHYYDRSDIFDASFQKVGSAIQTGKFITYSIHIRLQYVKDCRCQGLLEGLSLNWTAVGQSGHLEDRPLFATGSIP